MMHMPRENPSIRRVAHFPPLPTEYRRRNGNWPMIVLWCSIALAVVLGLIIIVQGAS